MRRLCLLRRKRSRVLSPLHCVMGAYLAWASRGMRNGTALEPMWLRASAACSRFSILSASKSFNQALSVRPCHDGSLDRKTTAPTAMMAAPVKTRAIRMRFLATGG